MNEIEKINNNTAGVEWKDSDGKMRKTKCSPIMCVCDTIARPMFQKFKQFNGEYGCSYCLHKGEKVTKGMGK